MRRTILAMLTIAFGFLYSCTNTNSTESTHSFCRYIHNGKWREV